ncbi:TOPRIM domain containing protein [Methylophilaceae bacterium]
MTIFLKNAYFCNRAPFKNLKLNFNKAQISVLTAINGSGKTTLISHIVDAFHEMAKKSFPNEYEGKENKFYRVSSGIESLNQSEPSLVYLRFQLDEKTLDYINVRGGLTEAQYDSYDLPEGKINFADIKPSLERDGFVKLISRIPDEKVIKTLFEKNLLTYFPSYRYEAPGYLNDPYKLNLSFQKTYKFSGYLNNPIEVVSGLPSLANWILDVVLDMRLYSNDSSHKLMFENINRVITDCLVSKKYGQLSFGIGSRNFGGTRVQIKKVNPEQTIYPSIFNMSSGEASLLCLFGELVRQSDNIATGIALSQVSGIVLIDEVDKHLHIKLQKDVLPGLFELFPNVQFVVSSHSPFLNMGLAEKVPDRSKVVDLDSLGIFKDPVSNDLYKEVYEMMISENDRFKQSFEDLQSKISLNNKPLILTEGKTDVMHLKKAMQVLNLTNLDVEFYDTTETLGDSKLKTLLENLAQIPQGRKIIGIFDRDVAYIVKAMESSEPFRSFGNNVYAFCIPVPSHRVGYEKISIEFYYADDSLKKENDGKRIYFSNELVVESSASDRKNSSFKRRDEPLASEEMVKKIIDENIGAHDLIHSKSKFAELVFEDSAFASSFDFTEFNKIFDVVKLILNSQQ